MLTIGLTGGIGSGKTTVATFFQKFGIDVIDSDQIAKQLVSKSEPAYNEIVARYGVGIIREDGELNRRELRAIIFSDTNEKRWLEDLLHPLIKSTLRDRIARSKSPYCVVVIPLLIETSSYDLVDRILVVDTPMEKQIEWTKLRDETTQEVILNIIKNQASREERLSVANDIIYNHGDLQELEKKTYQQHLNYMKMVNL